MIEQKDCERCEDREGSRDLTLPPIPGGRDTAKTRLWICRVCLKEIREVALGEPDEETE